VAKKKQRFFKFKTVGLIAAAAGTIGLLGVSFGGRKPINIPAYRVEKVIDGDTFDTEEHQVIRLAAVDASELDECGGKEAKKELEKLVLNQDIYLKVIWHDSSRLTAFVYTKNGSVDEAMLASGWAELHGQSDQLGVDKQKLALASQKAQKAGFTKAERCPERYQTE
jgi:endonuclease YncB( thermonuclease family)